MFTHRITERHELRLLQTSDADELFALVDTNRAHLRRWLPWLDSTTQPSDARKFIERSLQQFADNQGFAAAVCLDGHIGGVIGYHHIEWSHRIGSFGYWLAESHQGHGIMSASCLAIVSHAFTTLGLNRLVVGCEPKTPAAEQSPNDSVSHTKARTAT